MAEPGPADRVMICGLEERAFNAWPARKTVLSDGWLFRLSDGLSKRANSVNALDPSVSIEAIRGEAERLYRRHGLPAVFRLSPLAPAEADAVLEAAGYARFDPSRVMMLALPDGTAEGAATAPGQPLDLAGSPTAEWLEGFARANAIGARHRATHDAMIAAIALPAAFATLRQGRQAVGYGLAVVERGMVGLFDIVVAPEHRGRGLGRALTRGLLAWGRAAGAQAAYLQVRDQNTVALALYEGLGFRQAYRYHYRVPAAMLP